MITMYDQPYVPQEDYLKKKSEVVDIPLSAPGSITSTDARQLAKNTDRLLEELTECIGGLQPPLTKKVQTKK